MREFKNKSGIYQIRNTINGKIYIGKTKNFKQRYFQYLYAFKNRNEKHINTYLLNSMWKYGFENFEFSVIEFCPLEVLAERELYWIVAKDSTNKLLGYNLRLDTSSGMQTHPETSKKISARLRAEWESGARKEHSAKLKKSWEQRDTVLQSKLFSKTLTKYVYTLNKDGYKDIVLYKTLKEMGLGWAVGKMHRSGNNRVIFKGFEITKVSIDEDLDPSYYVAATEKLIIGKGE